MRAIIVGNGRPSGGEVWKRWVRAGDLIVGADGGSAQALAWGLAPHVIIGDMDSLPGEARASLTAGGCEFIVHPSAKDETDLELALSYVVERGFQEVIIFGALGGRLDHMLANVLLLALPRFSAVRIRIVDDREEALLIQDGKAVTVEGLPGDLVSLLPLGGDAKGVTTTGLVWALDGDILNFGSSRGVSNEMTGPTARISVEQGCLLVVHGLGG
ncbi:MAG: thiamine diphosphokinase [Anaerolineae bacterium]|nr:thiamine diphosphokinase [Anaerolineae bacterium]